jgi:hypothetical protein
LKGAQQGICLHLLPVPEMGCLAFSRPKAERNCQAIRIMIDLTLKDRPLGVVESGKEGLLWLKSVNMFTSVDPNTIS